MARLPPQGCAMTYELLLALALFAFVSSITPGPNNLMLMASGANFGLLRSVPHAMGIAIGFTLMVVLVGLGLAQVFEVYPVAHLILKVSATGYMLYLAWKIGTSAPELDEPDSGGTPMTFLQADAFQSVNPKPWAMALTAVTVYTPTGSGVAVITLVAVVFGLVNLPSIGAWAWLGVQMRRFLTTAGRLKVFNWVMAGLLVVSLWPILQM